jgi:hypothetical protein
VDRCSAFHLGIYLSTLNLDRGSTHGTEAIRAGFTGAAFPRSEFVGAQLIERTLRSKSILVPYRFVDYILGKRFYTIAPIDIGIDISPIDPSPLADQSLLLIGTRIYNTLTQYLLDEGEGSTSSAEIYAHAIRPFFVYRHDKERASTFQRNPARPRNDMSEDTGSLVGRSNQRRRSDQLAIVERHWDPYHQRVVFLICGIGSLATVGATRFAAEQYQVLRKLQDTYGGGRTGCWGIVLRFEDQYDDLQDHESIKAIPSPVIDTVVTDELTYNVAVGLTQLSDVLVAMSLPEEHATAARHDK